MGFLSLDCIFIDTVYLINQSKRVEGHQMDSCDLWMFDLWQSWPCRAAVRKMLFSINGAALWPPLLWHFLNALCEPQWPLCCLLDTASMVLPQSLGVPILLLGMFFPWLSTWLSSLYAPIPGLQGDFFHWKVENPKYHFQVFSSPLLHFLFLHSTF